MQQNEEIYSRVTDRKFQPHVNVPIRTFEGR